MDAQIDNQGRLIVTPTTKTEETALRAWQEKSWVAMTDDMRLEKGHWRGSSVIAARLPNTSSTP